MTGSEVARALRIDKAAVHRHLKALRSAGMVRRPRSQRKWLYYHLTPAGRRTAASFASSAAPRSLPPTGAEQAAGPVLVPVPELLGTGMEERGQPTGQLAFSTPSPDATSPS
jgi:DNA-binding transcriptional ArsR family regulator